MSAVDVTSNPSAEAEASVAVAEKKRAPVQRKRRQENLKASSLATTTTEMALEVPPMETLVANGTKFIPVQFSMDKLNILCIDCIKCLNCGNDRSGVNDGTKETKRARKMMRTMRKDIPKTFQRYHDRLLSLAEQDSSIFTNLQDSYLSHYGIQDNRKELWEQVITSGDITTYIHPIQVVARVAMNKGICIKGFIAENKTNGAYTDAEVDSGEKREDVKISYVGPANYFTNMPGSPLALITADEVQQQVPPTTNAVTTTSTTVDTDVNE